MLVIMQYLSYKKTGNGQKVFSENKPTHADFLALKNRAF